MSESLRRTLDSLARRESLAAVGEFAASLSHEVRNPLTAMRIDLQRVEEKLEVESPLRAPLRRALRAVDRLQHTVSGALAWRAADVSRTPVDLLVPLDAALHASEPEMQAAGARVEVDTGDALLVVLGDAAALEQLFNLLLNAAQAFDAPGGVVRVRASADATHARIEVEDAGRGMSSEALATAFEPFVTTRAQGTGLGLAIARRIAAAHGGELTESARNRHDGGRHHTACDLKRSPRRIGSLRAAATRDASHQRQAHARQRDTRRARGGAAVACAVGDHDRLQRLARLSMLATTRVPSPIATATARPWRGAGRA